MWQNIEVSACKYDPKISHKMSNSEKTVYYFLKRYIHFLCIYDPVYSLEINRIVTKEQEATELEKTK